MKVGSLFSGAGLGDYGLELAGMEIAFQVAERVGRHVMTINKKMFDSAHTEEVA